MVWLWWWLITCVQQGHLFRFLYQLVELPQNADVRSALGEKGQGLEEMSYWVQELDEVRYATEDTALRYTQGQILSATTWYRRHRAGAAVRASVANPDLKERLLALKEKRRQGIHASTSGLVGLFSWPCFVEIFLENDSIFLEMFFGKCNKIAKVFLCVRYSSRWGVDEDVTRVFYANNNRYGRNTG